MILSEFYTERVRPLLRVNRQQRAPQRLLALLALSVCLLSELLLDPTTAFARAGGGGGFGGGDSGGGFGGGGFGGGGSGGEGYLLYLLIRLVFRYPLIGIPLLCVVLWLMYKSGGQVRRSHQGRVIRHHKAKLDRHKLDRALEEIRRRDPGFHEAGFLSRVDDAFRKIQAAWSGQNLAPVRSFVSDGIFERFSLQIGMQQAQHRRNVMQNVEVLSTEIVSAHSDDSFDTLHVAIRARAVDYQVDVRTGKRIEGTTRPEEFTEYWSFLRRLGARTLEREGAIEGRCPKCAAPLMIVDRAQCEACGAHVNSGEYDWVLAEITQESVWRVPPSERNTAGLAELKQADPDFSIQHVEDRASVMFWRLRAAEFYGEIGYAAPILAEQPDAASGERDGLRPRVERDVESGLLYLDPAIGDVDLVKAEARGTDGRQRVYVKVRWSGKKGHIDRSAPDTPPQVTGRQMIYTHVFVLSRREGTTSTPGQVFSSAGCANCGAPIGVNREARCSFCGVPLTNGQYDWVLEEVKPFAEAWTMIADELQQRESARTDEVWEPGRPAAAAEGVHIDPELSLLVLARVMWLDGRLDVAERRTLKQIAAKVPVSDAEFERILDSAQSEDGQAIPMPDSQRDALAWLEQLVMAVMADGTVSPKESRLLSRYADRVGLTATDVKMQLARERRRRYREAKEGSRGLSS